MEQGEIEALLAQAKKGNQRAFNSLFDTHWEYVYRFLVQRIQNDQLAEEIAIESFAKAFDNIKNFNSNYTFKTWVITIAKNNLIDQHRQAEKHPVTTFQNPELTSNSIENTSPSPEDILIQSQQSERILTCIKDLPITYRTILKMRYFEGMNYFQIEKKLNLSSNLVKVRLFRAKKMLALTLSNETF